MSIIERLTTLFAPDDCLGCGREGSLLCNSCLSALPPPVGRCFSCNVSVIGVICTTCLESSGCTSILATADYRQSAKLLVACLKFRGNRSAARLMARHIVASCGPFRSGSLLAHVPATTAHIRQRGFDQAALIALELSRLTGLPRANLLRRSRQMHQLGADRQTRLKQLSSSIRVYDGDRQRSAHIILVDDVLTTGASIGTAAKALSAAGASSITAVVFAQAYSQ